MIARRPDSGSAVLLARDLRKSFHRETGETVHALDGVSLEVGRADLTALVGPDGAGKTTLLRLAAGLMPADSGELRVLGIDAAADPQQVQSRIAYMPQRFGLYEDLTVQENLDLYASLHGVRADERRRRYARLTDMTALGPFTGRLAGRLSGGMKQKLGLACTLVRTPELLLLDEPTAGIDPLSRRELWDIIGQLVEDGLSVVLSTSYLDEAQRCRHVVVLHQGRVLAQGAPDEVTSLASGHSFLVTPREGERAREVQARLLDEPDVVDAVPEGGQVRVVVAGRDAGSAGPLAELQASPAPSRFEDGFMMLLRRMRNEADRGAASLTSTSISSSSVAEDEARGVGPSSMQGTTRSVVVPDQGTTRSVVVPDQGTTRSVVVPDQGTTRSVVVPDQRTARRAVVPGGDVVVQVRDLVRRFGSFYAVDHATFDVRRGEIFGLLGPNGAGKTTTFRMLCGLIPATSGTLQVAGVDVRRARASARQRIGYVAQKFSLYGQLTVQDNLAFFASAYSLRGARKRERIDSSMRQFGLEHQARLQAGQLPGGYRQRLAMAAALLHEPELLFLDEPTSGADPLARREFWRRITDLAQHGVTVIVTTHFMEEAEYCDRAVILDSGRVLAQGTPAELRSHARSGPGRQPTMEDAFIAVIENARNSAGAKAGPGEVVGS